jgi:isopentenyl diphosphate isomerase/L-lactate dehydrogenase-like FMN-dependent dehydrogenase
MYNQTDLYQGKSATVNSFPASYEEWESKAEQILPAGPFGYIVGGAGSEETMRTNIKAFIYWRIKPHLPRDVSKRDLTVTLLGHNFPTPFFLAPIGLQGLANSTGELGTARAAAKLKIPFILSTVSSYPMEDVAVVMKNSPHWFQLYWPNDLDLMISFVRRAEKAGYSVIVVTIDYPAHSWKERNIRNNYNPFNIGEGMANYTSDPVFRSMLKQPPEQDRKSAISLFNQLFPNPHLTWDDISFLRKHTKLPIMVKGILNPKDAQLALQHGVDGIIVSNLEALPMICDVVKGRIPVLMDSGIRRGSDVIKALALGADVVLLGRPYIYGLAVAGEKGVMQVMKNLIAEIDATMANIGRTSIAEIDFSLLEWIR